MKELRNTYPIIPFDEHYVKRMATWHSKAGIELARTFMHTGFVYGKA